VLFGGGVSAESAHRELHQVAQTGGLLTVFLALRAFASGCTALTGVEAISNGVPNFRRPKSSNAAATLLMLGGIAAAMLAGILFLASRTRVHVAQDPAAELLLDGRPVGPDYIQHPVVSQLAETVFGDGSIPFYIVVAATGTILVFASNTAFNGFPVLASILARDGYLPRQMHTRGDRLAFSNGILTLAAGALALIMAFNADVTRLIQLYIVGVFVSFTASQLGMIRHWNRQLRTTRDGPSRRHIIRSRAVNSVGLGMTATVLAIVLVTKFEHGAWIALVAMAGLYLLMNAIHTHYGRVAAELAVAAPEDAGTDPGRVHAVLLVSQVHKPALRALAYARASRPDRLDAVTVDLDDAATRRTVSAWEALRLPVPLQVLPSPYRETTRPILDYLRAIRREDPKSLIVVYIPEYVVDKWWENLVHNQNALRIKARLHFEPGVMVASVPWQLAAEGQARG
jgi:hypothetical protein